MKSLFLLSLVILGDAHDVAGQEDVNRDEQAKRPPTVADSIEMNMIASDAYYSGYSLVGSVANFSPDGSKFVIVLRKGNLEQNTNEYSILLWRTSSVFQAPTPEVLLTMASSSNREAIDQVIWLDDNETLAFLGEHPGENRGLYTLDIRTRMLRRLSNHPTNVLRYGITSDGKEFAFTAEEPIETLVDKKSFREGFAVSMESLPDLMIGTKGGDRGPPRLFVQSGQSSSRLISIEGGIPWRNFSPYVAPNGRYILIPIRPAQVPPSWREYSDKQLSEWAQAKLAPGHYSNLMRFEIIDTYTGKPSILLNSPMRLATIPHVAWSADSRSVAISGVYLPLENTEGDERKIRQSAVFSVEVKVPSREVIVVSRDDLTLLTWDPKSARLIFEVGSSTMKLQPAPRVCFRQNGPHWERAACRADEENQSQIVLNEGINTPPRLFVRSPGSNRETLLWDLNPQFRKVDFVRVEEIRWKGADGQLVAGGIYYPANFVAQKRYPLVIQTHGWNSHRFWIDGAFPTAFAAQALAAKGIMVLQVDENYSHIDTFQEVSENVAAIEGAIAYLDSRSLIDRDRVGIIGFSRTCLYVKYVLTHSRYHFAAASVTDGFDGGYFQYVVSNDAGGPQSQAMEGINGGLPFGEGLESWIKRSSGFRLDRTGGPLRIMALDPGSLIAEWEWFSGLRRLGKPVEMVYIQDGAHVLERPWDRMISQQGNVDWFRFWLKGEEDPDPAKAEQYARWRKILKLRPENEAPTHVN